MYQVVWVCTYTHTNTHTHKHTGNILDKHQRASEGPSFDDQRVAAPIRDQSILDLAGASGVWPLLKTGTHTHTHTYTYTHTHTTHTHKDTDTDTHTQHNTTQHNTHTTHTTHTPTYISRLPTPFVIIEAGHVWIPHATDKGKRPPCHNPYSPHPHTQEFTRDDDSKNITNKGFCR